MNLNNMSWKTSLAAIAAIMMALSSMILSPIYDTDPTTQPRWGDFITVVFASSGIFSARDDDKTSEDVGANKCRRS